MTLINIKNLKIWDDRNDEAIIKDLSFKMKKNSCIAIVGESGSGKSMTVKAITGIHRPWIRCSGSIEFNGFNILEENAESMRKIRGKKIFMIFQDGMSAFDPSYIIRTGIRETLCEKLGCNKDGADKKIITAMEQVMLKNPAAILLKYPHQLSGGMLQRIMIALALALEPELIIADEPTTALDTITQFEVVEQFIKLRNKTGTSMIFISHDLGVVRRIADYVVVMKDGEKVEEGEIENVFTKPQHPYTQYLVDTRTALGENFRRIIEETEDVDGEKYREDISARRDLFIEATDDSFECDFSDEKRGMSGDHRRKRQWQINPGEIDTGN